MSRLRCFLCGAAVLKVDEHWDKSLAELMAEAGLKAIEESNLSTVDHVFVSNVYAERLQEQANLGIFLAEELGLKNVVATRVESGGVSGLAALYSAATVVRSGLSKAAMVVGVEKMSDGTLEESISLMTMEERQDYIGSFGVSQLAEAALLYKEYMRRYKVGAESIAYFSVLSHENSSRCSHAQYQFKLSLESVMNSPMIAEPIHRLEATAPADGAAAIIVVSDDLAAKLDSSFCTLTGLGFSNDLPVAFDREDPLAMDAVSTAGRRALEMAGLSRSEVDFLELHESYSVMSPLMLEALGFAERGQACIKAEKGVFALTGELPINTFGGLKGRGHPVGASGVYAVAEAFLQLVGEASKNQVEKAERGMVVSMAGLGAYAGAAVLEAVR
ncbi:MAG: thiolase family protein [Candidatus Caldarchaeum sp.]|nr:thiolase family protein [Candidatus Caldarchaeum sp.]